MAFKVDDSCIGCGGCEFACERGAISQGDGYPVLYMVDPLLCDDCEECVKVCPVDAISENLEFSRCYGRGCPLSSKKYAGWTCSVGVSRCEECGSMIWTSPSGMEVCNTCLGKSQGRHTAQCPKIKKVDRAIHLSL